MARQILLGFPPRISLERLRKRSSDEAMMLCTLILEAEDSSTELVGSIGEGLSLILERWIKAKDNDRMNKRVHRFRGIVASLVLGGVMAMVGTLGPLISSLSFSGIPSASTGGQILYAAAAMTMVSSSMLGLFTSRGRPVINVGASMASFAVVALVSSPLAPGTISGFWAVK